MYSCEKLAKGRKSRFESSNRRNFKFQNTPKVKQNIVRNKYEYNFADPRKYSVQIELYEDRPRGRVLSKKIR